MTGGRMLGDRYEIETTLGRGGMATVYAGRDRLLGRPVAIKMLAERYAGDESFVKRFRREARAAARLNHRNIVSVFDTGDTDGRHFIVMELVEGETLADLLGREGRLSPNGAARIAGSVAQALQAAHEQGLVHRDVKPANVMISSGGDVKVMDFGIARAVTDDTLTQTGMVLGTASYLSPEQSCGDPVDHRSDVYSLGCVLYEMLTGRPPFSGSPISVAYKHVSERPQRASALNPSVSPQLERVVMRSLEKDPADRFPSAEAFRDSLTSAAAVQTTEPLEGDTAVLPASTEPLEPSRAPRRWLSLGLLATGLLVGGIVALALIGGEEPDRRPGGERRRPEATPPVTGSPAATPAVTAVDEALFALRVLVEGNAGLLPEDAARGILVEADKARDEFLKGDVEKAFERLGVADAVIDAALVEGSTSEETALALHEGVELMRAAVRSAIDEQATEDVDNGDGKGSNSGPGNSENAPGHVKKEGDD